MGDIIPLNNGRSPMKRSGDLVTRKDVQEFVIGYVDGRVMEITEHYMQQIPGLVAHMLGEAFEANGLAFNPPMHTDDQGFPATGVPEPHGDCETDGHANAPTDSEKPE